MKVIYRDEDFLVVAKPSGLATTSPGAEECLVTRVRAALVPEGVLHPSSRLDREVSGLVTFALNKRAIRTLLEARKRGVYFRRYLALVGQAPSSSEGSWTGAIGISARDPRQRVVTESTRAKPACTLYRTEAALESGPALLELLPQTGRTHQLRVHASHAGSPILGDHHYGGSRRSVLADGRVVVHRRVMLHCVEVRFPSCRREPGRPNMVHSAPAPDDFLKQWVALGGQQTELRGAASGASSLA